MDGLTLTWISTVALLALVPIYWHVVWEYYQAWRGGETIRYFAPTVALLGAVALAATIILIVSVLVLVGRVKETTVLPPGVGLIAVAAAIFCPAPPMLALLRTLRGRRKPQ